MEMRFYKVETRLRHSVAAAAVLVSLMATAPVMAQDTPQASEEEAD
jgi:hypothetical protein